MSNHSPRVLTITAEFRVPPGLRKDVRSSRPEAGIAQLTGALAAQAATAMPWADELIVSHDWSYQWMSDSTRIELPKTELNTVNPDEEDEPEEPVRYRPLSRPR